MDNIAKQTSNYFKTSHLMLFLVAFLSMLLHNKRNFCRTINVTFVRDSSISYLKYQVRYEYLKNIKFLLVLWQKNN